MSQFRHLSFGQAMVRLLSIVVLVSAMGGCASNSISKIRQLEDDKTIMVVSGLGDTVNLRKVGVTVLSNSEREIPLPEWNMDHFVETETTRVIESSRFSPVLREPTARDLAFGENAWTGEIDFKGAENVLQAAALESGADLILVVYEIRRGDPFFQTNQVIHGYGYYEKSYIGSSKTIAYTYIAMSLYDAKTMTRLAGRAAWESEPVLIDVESITVPQVDDSREIFRRLVKRNIRNVLDSLEIL